MEMKDFNARGKAEIATRLELVHPKTGEPLSNDSKKAPAVWVYGFAARSVQKKLAALSQKKTLSDKSKDQASTVSLEKMFEDSIDTAMAYIDRFENCEVDGQPVISEKDMRKLLEFTFPMFGDRKNPDGSLALDANGQRISEIVNYPFSMQITAYVEKQGNE